MTISRSDPARVIRIVAAVVLDEGGRLLLVRKRGTSHFMLPGGKLAVGESPVEALARELEEELGCRLAGEPCPFGSFSAPAANEPDHLVEAEIFVAALTGEVRACSEIDELTWQDPDSQAAFPLAPLARDHVLPLVRAQRAAA